MEYALFEFTEGKRLVHSTELAALDGYKESEMEIHRVKSKQLKIISGTIKKNQNCDIWLESPSFVGADLAYIVGNRCNIIKLLDIRINEHSFVALVQGEITIHKLSISSFIRMNDLSIKDNIIQRPCILSMEWEIANSDALTQDNWIEVLLKALEQDDDDEQDESDFVRNTRDRDPDDILNEVLQRDTLFDDNHYTYHLTHTYDKEPRKIIITSNIEPYAMDLLIAYIQYQASEIDMSYGMDQEDIQRIIKEIYSESKKKDNVYNMDLTPCEIDLYINWEWWCGRADQVMNIELFHNQKLKTMLEEIVPRRQMILGERIDTN